MRFRARIGAKASYVALNGANGSPRLPVTFWGRVNIWRDFIANPPSATFATLSGRLDPKPQPRPDGALEASAPPPVSAAIDAGVIARVTRALSLTGSAFYDYSIDGGATWSLGGRIGLKLEF